MVAEPYDDPEIRNTDLIIRRVNPDQHLIFDENTKRRRISSKLFSPSSGPRGGMSVDIPKLMERDGVDVRKFVTNPTYSGSVCFFAGYSRNVGLRVGRDPIEGNPYHGEVWGSENSSNRFTRSQKRALMEASRWFVELEGVDIGG